MKRFTNAQRALIEKFFRHLAEQTRKSGKISDNKREKILRSWDPYPAAAVIDGISDYLKIEIQKSERGKGKNENYVLGIIKNKAGEASGNFRKNAERLETNNGSGEGERIAAMLRDAGKTTDYYF